MKVVTIVTVAAICILNAATLSRGQDPTCPFGPGTCPVELDNVIETFFHDPTDFYSCQAECNNINECHYFTMFTALVGAESKMKCLLFRTCDYLEPCPDCITGPETPPIDPCVGVTTCETSIDNILDIDYYDPVDEFSCQHQCGLETECNWWTQYHALEEDTQRLHHKCILFRHCDKPEICVHPECETGQKP